MLELLRLPSGWVGYVALLLGALGSIGLGGMFKSWLDHKYKSRKQSDDMATAIVTMMNQRMTAVERHGRLCEANLAFLRHRQNNMSGNFDALLLLIELAPEKAGEFIVRIKEMRRDQAVAEAAERAALLATAVLAENEPVEPDESEMGEEP